MAHMTHQETLGIAGTGALGSALAAAALRRGIPTTVWNRTRERARPLVDLGASVQPSVTDLFTKATVIVVAVSAYDDVRALLAEVDTGVRGHPIVNLSSGTPADAVAISEEVHRRGGRYVDGAAMGGTQLVGDPAAMYFYSGDSDAFERVREPLSAFGTALYLGSDPAVASAYDTAVLGMILGFLASGYQALALLRRQGVDADGLPGVIRDYWPFVIGLFDSHASQISSGAITSDDGTIDVYREAVQHLIDTGEAVGVDTSVAAAISALLQRTSADGHGCDGLPFLAETINTTGVHA
jgi:3-hydroxyisobutyrate dehydrogenase-like beta-hydroxyacid dehydrogenase